MNLKRFSADYLSFSRKERLGIVALFLIILIIYLIPIIHSYYAAPVLFQIDTNSRAFTELPPESRSDVSNEAEFSYNDAPMGVNYPNGELFYFDPNLASKVDWLRLGLSEKTVATIGRYVGKGGRFYKKEDLKRIWGLPAGFYERVESYIIIPPKESQFSEYERKEYSPAAKTIRITDVNQADSAALEGLPGIGAKLSSRIVNFREKLGGFYSVDQVGETYGLADSTFQKIRPLLTVVPASVRKININTATKDEMRSHPYIRWNLANAIAAYRQQHGNFKSVQDIKKIAVIDEKTYEKLYHYLTLD